MIIMMGKNRVQATLETVIAACVHINLGPCGAGDVIENIEAAYTANPPSREPAFTACRDTVLRLLVIRGSDSGHVTVCEGGLPCLQRLGDAVTVARREGWRPSQYLSMSFYVSPSPMLRLCLHWQPGNISNLVVCETVYFTQLCVKYIKPSCV
jgi:hypothetical protein